MLLMLYRVRGAILIGIALTSIVSWPRPTPVTYFPYTSAGDEMFSYFKQIVSFQSISLTDHALDVSCNQHSIITIHSWLTVSAWF